MVQLWRLLHRCEELRREISEMVAYLLYNKDLLISESGKDIFQLFFDLAIRAGLNHEELEPIIKK